MGILFWEAGRTCFTSGWARNEARKLSSSPAWEPPHRIDYKSVDGPYPAEVSDTLEPQNEETLLTARSQGEMGSFFKVAEGLIARQLENQIDSNHVSLKLLMESGQL